MEILFGYADDTPPRTVGEKGIPMAPSGAEDDWFTQMVREFEPALIGIARRRAGGAADDIVQSV